MKAIALTSYGAIENCSLIQLPTLEPKSGMVRVRVHSSALGPADYKVAKGIVKFLHGRKFPMILGYDFSGTVDAIAQGETHWKVGDSVFGFLPYGPMNNQGAFAEFILANSNQLALKPQSVSHEQAAASATAALTALQSIRDLGHLPSKNSSVLITGVSGAVGSTGVLVAKRLGANVTAIGSSAGLELSKQFGANTLVDRKQGDLFKKISGDFDVVFDAAAVYRWSDFSDKIKRGGAFVTTLPSATFAVDKMKSLMAKSSVHFVSVKSIAADLELLAKWLADGMKVKIDTTFAARDISKAFAYYEKGEYLGRIVIDVASGL